MPKTESYLFEIDHGSVDEIDSRTKDYGVDLSLYESEGQLYLEIEGPHFDVNSFLTGEGDKWEGARQHLGKQPEPHKAPDTSEMRETSFDQYMVRETPVAADGGVPRSEGEKFGQYRARKQEAGNENELAPAESGPSWRDEREQFAGKYQRGIGD